METLGAQPPVARSQSGHLHRSLQGYAAIISATCRLGDLSTLTRGATGARQTSQLAPCGSKRRKKGSKVSALLLLSGIGGGGVGVGGMVRILAGVHPVDNDMTRLNSWEPEWKDELPPRRYWLGPRSQEVPPRRRRFLMLHSRAQELCESRGGRPGLPSLISLRFLWT